MEPCQIKPAVHVLSKTPNVSPPMKRDVDVQIVTVDASASTDEIVKPIHAITQNEKNIGESVLKGAPVTSYILMNYA